MNSVFQPANDVIWHPLRHRTSSLSFLTCQMQKGCVTATSPISVWSKWDHHECPVHQSLPILADTDTSLTTTSLCGWKDMRRQRYVLSPPPNATAAAHNNKGVIASGGMNIHRRQGRLIVIVYVRPKMRWKCLSLLPICLGTQIWQHTRDPVFYCLCFFSPHPFQPMGPNGLCRRGGTSLSAKPWQMGRDLQCAVIFG